MAPEFPWKLIHLVQEAIMDRVLLIYKSLSTDPSRSPSLFVHLSLCARQAFETCQYFSYHHLATNQALKAYEYIYRGYSILNLNYLRKFNHRMLTVILNVYSINSVWSTLIFILLGVSQYFHVFMIVLSRKSWLVIYVNSQWFVTLVEVLSELQHDLALLWAERKDFKLTSHTTSAENTVFLQETGR